MGTHTFTREELYELVWSEPMSKLSRLFSISDRGLAKACAKVNVPVPGRGYWARLHAGQKEKRVPLPARKPSEPNKVTINPPEPPQVRQEPPPSPATVQAKLDEERRPEKRVTVPITLSNPHRIVAAWLEDDRTKRQEARHDPFLHRLYQPLQKNDVAKRRLRILSTLFKALETRNYRLISEGSLRSVVQIELKYERLDIELAERVRQRRRYLTKEEIRARGDLPDRPRWTQEKEPTGELVLRIKETRGYGRREWKDGSDHSLEDQINEVLGGIAAVFEEIRLRREREAIDAEKRRRAENERLEREREHQREMARYQGLIEKVRAWQTADEIRSFVEAVRNQVAGNLEAERDFSAWKEWALAHADRIDPLHAENPLG